MAECRIVGIIALGFLTILEVGSASAQQCPEGLLRCPAGSDGSGGCYNPGSASCEDGRVCPAPLKACHKGSNGTGGCYNIGQFTCNAGKICQISNPSVCLN
jgi:hypothetical protein